MRCFFVLTTLATFFLLGLSATSDADHGDRDIRIWARSLSTSGLTTESLRDDQGSILEDTDDDDGDDDTDDVEDDDDEGGEDEPNDDEGGDDDSDDDDGEDILDPETVLDGFPFKLLSKEEIYNLLEEDDDLLSVQLDMETAQRVLQERQLATTEGGQTRRKRWIPIAARLFIGAARFLFRGSRVTGVTSSGSRITRQYARPGNYNTAVKDFRRFNLQNVKSFQGRNGVNGLTGKAGPHKFTVRTSSSSGKPTLEINSPKGTGSFRRKIRYD